MSNLRQILHPFWKILTAIILDFSNNFSSHLKWAIDCSQVIRNPLQFRESNQKYGIYKSGESISQAENDIHTQRNGVKKAICNSVHE